MLERDLVGHRARLEYLGPIAAEAKPAGAVDVILDTVDIWLAGTLQSMFNLLKR